MKVNAFTLMEILVVLIISSIILYAAYFAFMNVNLYHSNLSASLNKKSDLLMLHSLLSRDFDRSGSITISGVNGISFNSREPALNTSYTFLENEIIRSTGFSSDTIPVSGEILEYKSHPNLPIVEAVKLQAGDFIWFFSKIYDGATLNDIHNGRD